MEKLFGSFSEFIGLLIVFVFLLLQRKKKKPARCDEAEDEKIGEEPVHLPLPPPSKIQTPSYVELHSQIEEREVQTRSVQGLLTQGEGDSDSPPRRLRRLSGRQLLLSYETLSLPLSLRQPRP